MDHGSMGSFELFKSIMGAAPVSRMPFKSHNPKEYTPMIFGQFIK